MTLGLSRLLSCVLMRKKCSALLDKGNEALGETDDKKNNNKWSSAHSTLSPRLVAAAGCYFTYAMRRDETRLLLNHLFIAEQ